MIGSIGLFRRRLLAWYSANGRTLPWRSDRPDAYHVLLSEAMLQQTTVAAVIPYFHRFLERFPTLAALASADEQEVLRLWQGLGYYSRARNLYRAAGMIAERFEGTVPDTVDRLMSLPGVGRYTAGAIASLAYGVRAPILDGNVIRVLCRLDRIEQDPRRPEINRQLWLRAEAILPRRNAGRFNSALMDLGATVCTPRLPACDACPVARHCQAAAGGVAELLPVKPAAKARPVERRWVFIITTGPRLLIEQRPATGRWASMWQFVTLPAGGGSPSTDVVHTAIGLRVFRPVHLADLTHLLTHRRYELSAYRCTLAARMAPSADDSRRWVTLDALATYPLPGPHVRLAAMLRAGGGQQPPLTKRAGLSASRRSAAARPGAAAPRAKGTSPNAPGAGDRA